MTEKDKGRGHMTWGETGRGAVIRLTGEDGIP